MIRRRRNANTLPKFVILATLLLLGVFALYKFVSHESKRETIPLSQSPSLPGTYEVVSWRPRIFLARGFLTPEECDRIIQLGGKSVERSLVVGHDGKGTVDQRRTSYGAFLSDHVNDPVYKSISAKIEKWTHIPASHGEVMYLLRYEKGQEYRPHYDYFDESHTQQIGKHGNRIATVVMYLSDVEEGGETYFPNAEGGEIVIKPKKGDAILFWDYTTDGKPDPLSLHGGRPVIKGTKWSLTRWIRMRPLY